MTLCKQNLVRASAQGQLPGLILEIIYLTTKTVLLNGIIKKVKIKLARYLLWNSTEPVSSWSTAEGKRKKFSKYLKYEQVVTVRVL